VLEASTRACAISIDRVDDASTSTVFAKTRAASGLQFVERGPDRGRGLPSSPAAS
jgi:hypothetical protein